MQFPCRAFIMLYLHFYYKELPYLWLFILPVKHPEVSSACSLSLTLNTAPTTSTNKIEQTVCSPKGKTQGEKNVHTALTTAALKRIAVWAHGDNDSVDILTFISTPRLSYLHFHSNRSLLRVILLRKPWNIFLPLTDILWYVSLYLQSKAWSQVFPQPQTRSSQEKNNPHVLDLLRQSGKATNTERNMQRERKGKERP